MLNLDIPMQINIFYNDQRDTYIRAVCYAPAIIPFINIIRRQVSEVNLLQLVPGFYLLLLYIAFLLLIISSTFFVRFAFNTDSLKAAGTKVIFRLETIRFRRLNISLLINTLIASFLSIIPLSLDSFNTYGEKTLENIWSLDEVLGLEIILLITMSLISQVPVYSISFFDSDKRLNSLPKIWKKFSFFVFVLAGFLTPTIDGYTQLGFASAGIFLYLFLINLLQKRRETKFIGTSILGF